MEPRTKVCTIGFNCRLRSFYLPSIIMQNFNWTKLQNGSDIRGIALEGVPNEKVNLTPDIAAILGKSFVSWLVQKVNKPAAELTIAIGRDSRLSGPILTQAVMEGIASVGATVYDFEMASTPAMAWKSG